MDPLTKLIDRSIRKRLWKCFPHQYYARAALV